MTIKGFVIMLTPVLNKKETDFFFAVLKDNSAQIKINVFEEIKKFHTILNTNQVYLTTLIVFYFFLLIFIRKSLFLTVGNHYF